MAATEVQDKRSEMLRKIRGLVDKANATDQPGERDVFLAKADELMQKYRIEQHELEKARPQVREEPIGRMVDFSWYRGEFGSPLYQMMMEVALHTSVVICPMIYYNDTTYTQEIPVVGRPSNLDYFDMLFTSLYLQFSSTLDPQWETHMSVRENIFRMKQAGIKWDAIAAAHEKHGGQSHVKWVNGKKRIGPFYINEYKKACAAKGAEPQGLQPQVWQRSFAMGFTEEVSRRIRDQRDAANQSHGSDKYALVLRSALSEASAKARELYPEAWNRSSSGGSGRGRRTAMKQVKISHRAIAAGQREGMKADLGGNSRVQRGAGQIGEGK